jgi:hypothetical protein
MNPAIAYPPCKQCDVWRQAASLREASLSETLTRTPTRLRQHLKFELIWIP